MHKDIKIHVFYTVYIYLLWHTCYVPAVQLWNYSPVQDGVETKVNNTVNQTTNNNTTDRYYSVETKQNQTQKRGKKTGTNEMKRHKENEEIH